MLLQSTSTNNLELIINKYYSQPMPQFGGGPIGDNKFIQPAIINILMNKLSNTKSQIFSHKSQFDDSSSLTSSTITYRLSRRKDQKSSQRKSLSRKSSDKSLGELDVSKFYVKMSPGQEPKDKSPSRRNIMNRIQQPLNLKKRSPTPLPGYNHRKNNEKTLSAAEPIETDLLIAELQQKYKEEKDAKQLFQKRLAVFEKEIKAKLGKIQELQILWAQSKQREEASQKKLHQYQEIINISEANLNQARSSLQKLKNTIKQNKYAQIESDNNRLNAQNKMLKQNMAMLQQDNDNKQDFIGQLNHQINILKVINQNLTKYSQIQQKNQEIQLLRQIISSSKTSREEELEKYLAKITQEKESLKLKLDKLEIQLNYISRKKNQEMETFKQAKNLLIGKLRLKISTLHTQNNNLREEISRLKEKNGFGGARRNLFFEDSDHNLFELTPQKSER